MLRKIITIILVIILSLACSKSTYKDSDYTVNINFKPSDSYSANKKDVIIIREKLSNKILFENEIGNKPIVYISLKSPIEFFVEIKRNNVKYLSTFVSNEQIRKALLSDNKKIIIGDINSITTALSYNNKDIKEYFEYGINDYSDINHNHIKSEFVKPTNIFYQVVNKINAISIYYQILENTKHIDENHDQLFDVILKTNDTNNWRDKAYSIDLPDSESSGLNLISNILSKNYFIESNNHNLLKPEELRSIFWKTYFSDNILNYIGGDIILNENGKLDIDDNISIVDLNVKGNLFINDEIFTSSNEILNYYTLDNTITNNYTLDNTITNNYTQLTNTFLLSDFDNISGNSIYSQNIFLSDNIYVGGGVLKPITNYYTLDNTITNNYTQLTNTFLLSNFDSISGNSIYSQNIFLSDNIYVGGEVLKPITNNYTLDNTITNNYTQLTNTFLLSNFDSISGNNLTLSNNLKLHGNLEIVGNFSAGNFLNSNIIQINNNLYPKDDNMYSLGVSSKSWKSVYTYKLYLTSDKNLKENIIKESNGVDLIKKLNPVEYNFKNNKEKRHGFIAQEVEKILPDIVIGGNIKTINYIDIISILTKSIQEQQTQIEEHQKKIEELSQKINKIN
jgi:hypothetical protein